MSRFDKTLNNLHKYSTDADVSLTAGEKERIFNSTVKKINSTKKANLSKRVIFVAAAVLCIGIAANAAKIFMMNDGFKRFFRAGNNVDISGENISVSDYKSGVKVTAEQIIGDDFGLYVLFEAEGKNISSKSFENVTAAAKGVNDIQNSDMIMMGAKDGNHSSFVVHIASPEALYGKELNIRFENLGEFFYDEKTGETKFKCEKAKSWDLKWTLDFVPNKKVSIDVNREVSVYGGKANWQKLYITPLSASVKLSETEKFKVHTDKPNDVLYVKLTDGTIIRSDYAAEGEVMHDTTSVSIFFKRIVNYSEIESVTFAGEEINLNESKNIVPRKLYIDKNNRFTIDMTAKLCDMASAEEKDGYDKELKTKVYTVSFTAENDGIKTVLFEVNAYKGDFSHKEIDEKKPLEMYISASDDGYVYTLNIAEPQTEREIELYSDIMNNEIAKIKERINVIGN